MQNKNPEAAKDIKQECADYLIKERLYEVGECPDWYMTADPSRRDLVLAYFQEFNKDQQTQLWRAAAYVADDIYAGFYSRKKLLSAAIEKAGQYPLDITCLMDKTLSGQNMNSKWNVMVRNYEARELWSRYRQDWCLINGFDFDKINACWKIGEKYSGKMHVGLDEFSVTIFSDKSYMEYLQSEEFFHRLHVSRSPVRPVFSWERTNARLGYGDPVLAKQLDEREAAYNAECAKNRQLAQSYLASHFGISSDAPGRDPVSLQRFSDALCFSFEEAIQSSSENYMLNDIVNAFIWNYDKSFNEEENWKNAVRITVQGYQYEMKRSWMEQYLSHEYALEAEKSSLDTQIQSASIRTAGSQHSSHRKGKAPEPEI